MVGEYRYRAVVIDGGEKEVSIGVEFTLLAIDESLITVDPLADYKDCLVGWWRFEERSGEVVLDSSGNGYGGRIYGDIERVSGKMGNALWFNRGMVDGLGCSEHVLLPDLAEGELMPEDLELGKDGGDFTVSYWVKIDIYSNSYNTPIFKGVGGYNEANMFSTIKVSGGGAGPNIFFSANEDGGSYSTIATPIPGLGSDNQADNPKYDWVNVVMVRDSGVHKLFINGVQKVEREYGYLLNNYEPILLGAYGRSSTATLWGGIDEVMIFNCALPADAITDILYNNGEGYKGMVDNLPGCDPVVSAIYAGGDLVDESLYPDLDGDISTVNGIGGLASEALSGFGEHISFDGEWLAVANSKADVEEGGVLQVDAGAVDMYRRNAVSGQWKYVERITAKQHGNNGVVLSDVVAGSQFSGKNGLDVGVSSVSVSNGWLAVSQYIYTKYYAVYLYRYEETSGQWEFSQKLVRSSNTGFGFGVALEQGVSGAPRVATIQFSIGVQVWEYDLNGLEGAKWQEVSSTSVDGGITTVVFEKGTLAIGSGYYNRAINIFDLSSDSNLSNPVRLAEIDLDSTASGGRFGVGLGVSGDRIAVSNYNRGTGIVYMLSRSSGSWQLEEQIVAPDTVHSGFGYRLALFEDMLLVSSRLKTGSNRFFIYQHDENGGWQLWDIDYDNSFPYLDSVLGLNFIDNNTLLVGDRLDNSFGANTGAVYELGNLDCLLTDGPGEPLPISYTFTEASGSDQEGYVGLQFNEKLSVRLVDQYGNGVPNATISFSLNCTGIVSFAEDNSATTATTDALGMVSLPLWAIGRGECTVVATYSYADDQGQVQEFEEFVLTVSAGCDPSITAIYAGRDLAESDWGLYPNLDGDVNTIDGVGGNMNASSFGNWISVGGDWLAVMAYIDGYRFDIHMYHREGERWKWEDKISSADIDIPDGYEVSQFGGARRISTNGEWLAVRVLRTDRGYGLQMFRHNEEGNWITNENWFIAGNRIGWYATTIRVDDLGRVIHADRAGRALYIHEYDSDSDTWQPALGAPLRASNGEDCPSPNLCTASVLM